MFVRRKQRAYKTPLCNKEVFGDVILVRQNQAMLKQFTYSTTLPNPLIKSLTETNPFLSKEHENNDKKRTSELIDELLLNIYSRDSCSSVSGYTSATSFRSQRSFFKSISFDFEDKNREELLALTKELESHVVRMGSALVRKLKRRDALRRQRDAHCDVITDYLRKQTPETMRMRFSINPVPNDSGFDQWHSAMRMVAQLPGGIPSEFRRKLWLNLAESHLNSRNVDWEKVERDCFSEWSHPADAELGVQIVKDLHRTGCSLFCGEDGQENQALLKRVLLAYARWNKAVGYCQGFNMLAALILQVTEKCESEALKMMIFLIEGVLPESYFADSLRGLSVDMAAFRELLKTRLPRLSRHLDTLQTAAKDGTTSYEPPLTNVFTMQWFLTLFCNCLPQPTVLRVWDLILLEGNEVLLRTALAIWQTVGERIMTVRSADEFYCIMGVITREILEFGAVDANALIKSIVVIGALTELPSLREKYLYNINPWSSSISAKVDAEVRNRQVKVYGRERLTLDITALKKQYAKLKQRQRQAHIIFSAAVARQSPRNSPVVAMNHLLLGKCALAPVKRIGPPKGSIPPPRQIIPTTLHWKDTLPRQSSSSSSSDTELCDDPDEREETSSPPNVQLQDDNLSKPNGDINLMKLDNISDEVKLPSDDSSVVETQETTTTLEESESEVDNNQLILKTSDIFDTIESTKQEKYFDFARFNVQSDSDDDGFDFENFLESRVQCLKQSSIDEQDVPCGSEIKKVGSTRKNSQRALEIIQENSLILHRILQCQARLTPSPPPGPEPTSPNNNATTSFISESPLHSILQLTPSPPPREMTSPDYNATSFLVHSPKEEIEFDIPSVSPIQQFGYSDVDTIDDNGVSLLTENHFKFETFQEEDKSEINSLSYNFTNKFEYKDVTDSENENIYDSAKTILGNERSSESKYDDDDVRPCFTQILDSEYTRNLDEKYENLILKSSRPKFLDVVSNLSVGRDLSKSPSEEKFDDDKSPTSESSSRKSREEEPAFLRSPTSGRIYNPFPVNISSRQNKDVGFRLGLYKKS